MEHTEGFLKLVADARSRVREVGVEQTLERVRRGARLIDVREDGEWQRGHAAGAEHLGRGVIERDIEREVPKLIRHLSERHSMSDARICHDGIKTTAITEHLIDNFVRSCCRSYIKPAELGASSRSFNDPNDLGPLISQYIRDYDVVAGAPKGAGCCPSNADR